MPCEKYHTGSPGGTAEGKDLCPKHAAQWAARQSSEKERA